VYAEYVAPQAVTPSATEFVGYGDRSCAEGFTAIAMLLSRTKSSTRAEGDWRATTRRLGVSPFRMSTFVSQEKDEGRRAEVLTALLQVMTDSCLLVTSAVVNDATFALLPGPIHSEPTQHRLTRHRLAPKYIVLATMTFALAARWCHDNHHEGMISCVFEKGTDEEGQADFQDTVERILNNSALLSKYNIATIGLAPKGSASLEMADTLAWLMTHWVPELYRDPLAERCIDRFRSSCIGFERWYLDRQTLMEIAARNTPEVEQRLIARYGTTFGYRVRP
jgi:hypothetical protein